MSKAKAQARALDSGAVSAFCEGVAMMYSAGIQLDEAVDLLGDGMRPGQFRDACDATYRGLIQGKSLSAALDETAAFPRYAVDMVHAGESSGRVENVLFSLANYYNEEDRLFAKIRSAIVYPAALLAVMTAILLFTVVVILPVFMDVYENLAGSVAASSFGYVDLSLIVGWIALVLMSVCTVIAFVGVRMSHDPAGRERLISFFEGLGATHDAMYDLALSRFTAALSTYCSTGMDSDVALERTIQMTTHKEVLEKANAALAEMLDMDKGVGLAQAIYNADLFDPLYSRMMMVGSRSGSTDKVLTRLSNTFFDDGVMQVDSVIDSVEPALAAFLTVSVGATLIAVMLPLIGIMGSIG